MSSAPLFPNLAVVSQRRDSLDGLDFYPTPPWATRALLAHVLPALGEDKPHICSAWDPACGEGHMSEVLAERIAIVKASDVHDYGRGYAVADFLDPGTCVVPPVDLLATNPPFKDSVAFAERAFETMGLVVALLLRTQWLEGVDRYERIFRDRPPTLFAPFVERVPMTKGRWDPDADTMTFYAWFVWVREVAPRPPFWIPPGCRVHLTRPDDAARFAKLAPAPLFDEASS